jgi:hypothetical protein
MTSQQFQPEDPEMIQRRIRQAREQVLGGRGPGASPLETARWTRERPTLGGQPPAASREQAAEQAKLARSDPADLTQLAARRSARLAATLGTARTRLSRRLTSARKHARVAIPVALTGAGIVLALQAGGRRRNRPTQGLSGAVRKHARS